MGQKNPPNKITLLNGANYIYKCILKEAKEVSKSNFRQYIDTWKGTGGKSQRREERRREEKRREKRREEKRREEKKKEDQERESFRRKKIQMREKGRKVGSRGSKSRLAKAAGVGPCGQMKDEKVHTVVVRSTFRSQNVQSTPMSEHFWKLRCRKSARHCGAKHISKSKCTSTLRCQVSTYIFMQQTTATLT